MSYYIYIKYNFEFIVITPKIMNKEKKPSTWAKILNYVCFVSLQFPIKAENNKSTRTYP